jgi:hypothetical protein
MLSFTRREGPVFAFGLSLIVIGLFTSGCDSASPSPKPSSSDASTSPRAESKPKRPISPGNTSNNDTQPETPAFDLCADGLTINDSLRSFSSYIRTICTKSQLEALRNPSSIFTGEDNKIIEKSKDIGDLKSNFTLMTSAIYQKNVESYWQLLRLQFLKPKVFSENFERDPDAVVTGVEPSSDNSSVNFRYENSSGEGGKVDYIAKTDLIEIASDTAYVVATQLTESKETLTDLKGLILVHKIDDSSIEVFTISYQEYSHASGQGKTYYDRALRSMRAEQKRTWNNAKNADIAKDLIDP